MPMHFNELEGLGGDNPRHCGFEVAGYFKNLSIPLSFEDRFGDLYGRESNRQQKRFPPAFQGNPEKSKDISMLEWSEPRIVESVLSS
jgi:hypothetical protein